MAVHITLPIKISFNRWACSLYFDFPYLDIPLPPKDETDWREWAENLIYNNNLSNVPIPDKKTYPNKEDWITWAEFFVNTVYIYT
jgi:hypothetical protein